MKKLLALVLVAVLALGMVPAVLGEAALPKIGVAIYKFDDTFMTGVRNAIEEAAKEVADISMADSLNQQPTQNDQVTLFLGQDMDALAINPVDRTACPEISKKAQEADVPVVYFNREPIADEMVDFTDWYYVGAKAEESGTMSGELIADYFAANPDKLGDDGVLQYVMLQGEPGHQDAELRTEYSLKALADAGVDYGTAFVVVNDIVGIMPGASPLFLKLLFEKPAGKVLGAQAIGQGAAEKRIDVIATAIRFGATVYDLKDLDLCYSPLYSTARDPVNQAALQATNLLEGKVRQVPFSQMRALAEKGEYLLDVREEDEYALGHVKGARNIPLSQLRERMDEIPRDRPVFAYCRSGARSYNAARAMAQDGLDAYNIAGSFLALSWHEYYQDQVSDREPIVTSYNFE